MRWTPLISFVVFLGLVPPCQSSASDNKVPAAQTDQTVVLGAHERVTSLAVSVDGATAISGGQDGMLRVWDLTKDGDSPKVLATGAKQVQAVAFADENRFAITAGGVFLGGERGEAFLALWDLQDGSHVRQFIGHEDYVTSLAVLDAGRRIVSGSADGTVRVWDRDSGRQLREFRHGPIVQTVSTSPDGKLILSGALDGSVRIWSLDRDLPVGGFEHQTSVVATVWMDSAQVVVASAGQRLDQPPSQGIREDATLRLWNVLECREVARFVDAPGAIASLALAEDGRVLLIGTANSKVQPQSINGLAAFDMKTRSLLQHWSFERAVSAIAVLPGNQGVLLGTRDDKVRRLVLEH